METFVGIGIYADPDIYMNHFTDTVSNEFGYEVEDGASFWSEDQHDEPSQTLLERDGYFILKGVVKFTELATNEIAYLHFELMFKLE